MLEVSFGAGTLNGLVESVAVNIANIDNFDVLGVLLHGAEVIGRNASAADKCHADLAIGNRGVVMHLFLLQAEYSEAGVSGGMAIEQAFQVCQNRLVTTAERAQFRNMFAPEFVVSNGHHQCIHRMFSIDGTKLDAVLMGHLFGDPPTDRKRPP